ncbi:MAG: hypothetical protein RL764_394 [Pseudomonadota bacterium]|jgi:hypothetical protein
MNERIETKANLWSWASGNNGGNWHFLTIAGEAAEDIKTTAIMRRLEGEQPRGWGAIRVSATIGDTSWQTSIFPSRENGGYLLPIKAAVRNAEGLVAGDEVTVHLRY